MNIGDKILYVRSIQRYYQSWVLFINAPIINGVFDWSSYKTLNIGEKTTIEFIGYSNEEISNAYKLINKSDYPENMFPMIRIAGGCFAPMECFDLISPTETKLISCDCHGRDTWKLAAFGCLKPKEHR